MLGVVGDERQYALYASSQQCVVSKSLSQLGSRHIERREFIRENDSPDRTLRREVRGESTSKKRTKNW